MNKETIDHKIALNNAINKILLFQKGYRRKLVLKTALGETLGKYGTDLLTLKEALNNGEIADDTFCIDLMACNINPKVLDITTLIEIKFFIRRYYEENNLYYSSGEERGRTHLHE
jgi:hypothetical protein